MLFLHLNINPGQPAALLNDCQAIYHNRLPLSKDTVRTERLPNWQDPVITADRAAIFDLATNTFLWEKNSEVRQPLASITKLMTALVFLDNNPGWGKIYKISLADNVVGGKVSLFLGEELKVKDLFYSSLVASDNGATIALVHATGLSETEFIAKMNAKARQLGLFNTSFVDPIGLSDNNLSSARDIARLAKAALKNEEIKKATLTEKYKFQTLGGQEKKVESTDYLLGSDLDNEIIVQGGKTGYTEKAGYC
ncbi:MAG: serine hydrolase, partial [Candidatus Falkowbacteria bacterium]|nr:serine hydrolase [Candidatus Falkowbacteria bacterium]